MQPFLAAHPFLYVDDDGRFLPSDSNESSEQHDLHRNKIDGVDAISRRNQDPLYIVDMDQFEWHLAMIDISPMEMKVDIRKKGNENFTKVLAITDDLQHCKDLQHEALSVQDPLDTLQATLQNANSGSQSNDSALRSERSKQGNPLQPAEHGGIKSDLDLSNDPFAKQRRTEKEVENLYLLAMQNILPTEMKERTFSVQNSKYPHSQKYPHSPADSTQWEEAKMAQERLKSCQSETSKSSEKYVSPGEHEVGYNTEEGVSNVFAKQGESILSPAEHKVGYNTEEGVSNVFAKQGEPKLSPAENKVGYNIDETEKEVQNPSSTYFSDKFRPEAGRSCRSETSTNTIEVSEVSTVMVVSKTFNRAFNSNKDVKLGPTEPAEDSLLQRFGFEHNATRVVQQDGPSDGHRRGSCGGGRGTANRGGRGRGRGRSNHGARGVVSKNRTALGSSVNIGCAAKLLSYTAYGACPQAQAFQNSAAFVSAAYGESGIQFNGTRFAPVNESYQANAQQ